MERCRIMAAVGVMLLLVLMLTACSWKSIRQDVLSGGTTDRTDHQASKEIKSRDITYFNVNFYFKDPWYYEREGPCSFRISENEEGHYVLQARGYGYSIEEVIDAEKVLPGIQEIIDRYDLVKCNGVYRVTAGLPPEYGPWALDAGYASGEELHFYENGAPYAAWTEAFKVYFEGILAELGHEEVLPPKEELVLEKVTLCFDDGDELQEYREIEKGDGSRRFISHTITEIANPENFLQQYAEITDEYYDGLQAVFEEYAFRKLHHPDTVSFDLDPKGESFLEIYVDYANGSQIYAELTEEELTDSWPVMRAAFREYVDAYIEEHLVEREAVFGE